MSNTIKLRRGLKANLPTLNQGEPAFTTDTNEFYIGNGTKNIAIGSNIFQTATGTATAITLNLGTLINGYSVTFIAIANNNGAATTINGLQVYKPNTTSAPTIESGKSNTIWYNSTSNCFFF